MNRATKLILISALVMAIPMVAYLCYQYFRPPADVANMVAAISATAQHLGDEYMKDEIQSDAKYLGKIVDISGRVAEVQINNSEGSTVYFEANKAGAPVAVLMAAGIPENEYPAKGDSVLIRAFCTGFLMDVTFNRGVMIRKY